MRAYLGEEGTEQFTVETRIDGETIKVQPIHDPFIHNTTVIHPTRWDYLKAIFKRPKIKIEVDVRGGDAVQRAIMTMDPEQLSRENEEILHERQLAYEARCKGEI